MTTKYDFTFRVNGIIDTNKSVISNMKTLAGTAGSWITFDISQGKFAVVINKTGSADWTFDDSNIIGSITVSGTGLTEYYNAIEYDFPNKDIVDQVDTTTFVIPVGQRYPNEPENTLKFAVDTISDPIVAQYLAAIELNQSRVDKIVQFRTDFTSLGVVAGDLFSLTSEMYGFTNKLFRVVTVEEEDADDGNILLAITGLEYDANVYDTSNLVRQVTETGSGILSKDINNAVISSNNQASVPLGTNAAAAAAGGSALVFNPLTGKYEINQTTAQATLQGTSGVVINWTFDSGSDLDIRCRFVSPNLLQSDVDQYVGWTDHGDGSIFQWPLDNPIIEWGGDNTGIGIESVLFDVEAFKIQHPTKRYAVLECRANWFGTKGNTPVQLSGIIYNADPNSWYVESSTIANIAPNTQYLKGTLVRTNLAYYQCIKANTSAPDSDGSTAGYQLDQIATSTAYAVGDWVYIGNVEDANLYRCEVAHTSPANSGDINDYYIQTNWAPVFEEYFTPYPNATVWKNSNVTSNKILDGLKVYVDSDTNSLNDGAYALGDLVGYFVWDTQTSTGFFTTDYSQYTS